MTKTIGITPLRRFLNLLKVDRQEVFSIYIYAIFSGIVTLSIPLGIQAIINLLTVGQVSTSWILLVGIVIVGVAFTGVLQVMQLAVSENLQQKIFARSAFEFAYRIPRMQMEAVDKSYIPELVNRFFDTLSVQKGLSKILIDFSSATLQVVFGLILLSLYHPFFILFSFLLVIIVYLIFRFTIPQGLKTSLVESKYKYKVAHWLEELARAMETFKLAGKTDLPLVKTDEVVAGYLNSRKAHFKTLVIQYINLIGFKVIIAAGLLLIGGLLVINQQMNIGQFVASEIIIILILGSVEKLILSMETIYDVLTAIEKIGTVTDIPLERDEGTHLDMGDFTGLAIQLRGLSYRFPDASEDTLHNIDLSIKSGERICISGYNGSGKSLLLQLIAGLYSEYKGSLAYNSIPLGNWSKEELRTVIGDSLAREDIFQGTLLENITLGRDNIDMEEVQRLTEVVGLEEAIREMPLGYSTPLYPEGRGLPKSVRLRIVLARCLAGSPRLILLGDNFNHLVGADRNRFLDFVLASDQDWTVIAVSREESVARRFQRVVVLDHGRLIGEGKLSQLRQEEWYNQVFQLGGNHA